MTETDRERAAMYRDKVVTLAARVRALTDAGNALADELDLELAGAVRSPLDADAALTAWVTLTGPDPDQEGDNDDEGG